MKRNVPVMTKPQINDIWTNPLQKSFNSPFLKPNSNITWVLGAKYFNFSDKYLAIRAELLEQKAWELFCQVGLVRTIDESGYFDN